ncbi:bifunctional aspartate kinase/homoserine dehydrogenase I [Flavobacterium selenitireducens]|uniref:bifunctional aspartate kinase/homoserine dehydrogenase I n=1 Tax=Flavobacterium selenitireducens TaxID=2722704 RepID=UPI00168B88CB|nr:bifunctional aspartate kinase/homoserine dehydrogenase I [Flavobacterium selenitireducens]MBD3580925.1 bifunctional aspartate kinase/homoserine dehydrogenase I [Flavobacterium selenitireducens]
MIVMKFGGTSVANAQNVRLVCQIVSKKSKIQSVIVVVSAFGGVTDLLVSAGRLAASKQETYRDIASEIEKKHLEVVRDLLPIQHQSALLSHVKRLLNHLDTLLDGCFLLGELSPRTSDTIIGFGELLSSCIVAEAIKQSIPESRYKDSRELIKTDDNFGKANVNFSITNTLIKAFFESDNKPVTILPGFIGSTQEGENTTLGRGGSDFTASIIASAIGARQLEIWTDVNGMYTANPKIVAQAQPIASISYQEAMELSHFGAKVLYPPTIQPALDHNIPILIKNTFEPEAAGTWISSEPKHSENPVKGISHIENICLLTLEGSGMIGVAGSSKRLFEVLSDKAINVIFITQASSEHSICVGILDSDAEKASSAIDKAFEAEILLRKIEPCIVETGLCIVAVVGENMKNHQGLSGKMFSTLGKNNVNIRAIAQGASERNISVVIRQADVKKALNALHERFFEDDIKQLNLFVTGVGNVGGKFLDQICQQQTFLRENLRLNLRVVALSNSRTMIFDERGISLNDWEAALTAGMPANISDFIGRVKQLNLRNSIFVDNTANPDIAATYAEFLRESVAVVTCNKIACSSDYDGYRKLKNLSRKYAAPFLFETNVGAGLPIIDTLKHMVASGDKIRSIQAVLSGSLNFIFNNFTNGTNFHDIVKEAGIQGFTEPDPKIDLSGVDVARKILILIRESGYEIEMSDIENTSFLPETCRNTTSVPDFFESLASNAKHFDELYENARSKGCRLKYVARFQDGKASVGLQLIPESHPFYDLEGKDNIVLFYTDRYPDQPLLIKGAGAGAAVTASGIFADVIRVGNN